MRLPDWHQKVTQVSVYFCIHFYIGIHILIPDQYHHPYLTASSGHIYIPRKKENNRGHFSLQKPGAVMRTLSAVKRQTVTDNVLQTVLVPTYLSGKHKQRDEKDEEGDRAHRLQVFENTWSWRAEKSTEKCEWIWEWWGRRQNRQEQIFVKKKKKKLDKREKSVMQEKKENLIKDGNRECVQWHMDGSEDMLLCCRKTTATASLSAAELHSL